MIVTVVRNDATEYVLENYTFAGVKGCCNDAGSEWLTNAIGFGYYLNDTVHTRLVVTRSLLAPLAKLGGSSYEIKYCPHCGTEITIQVEERV